MNKYINKDVGINAISSYKRASNIIDKAEKKIAGSPDVILFRTEEEKLLFEKLEKNDVAGIQNPTIHHLRKFAIDYADAVVQASPTIDKITLAHIKSSGKPFMQYPGAEEYVHAYQDFYEQLIGQEEELEEESEEIALTEN